VGERWLVMTLGSALAIAALGCGADVDADTDTDTGAAVGSDGSEGQLATVEGSLRGVPVTDEEAATLRELHAAQPELSAADLADVIGLSWDELSGELSRTGPPAPSSEGLAPLRQALREGEDGSVGDCSVIFLRGRDDGAYHFEQFLFKGASAVVGTVTISTDGSLAIPDFHDLDGPQQIFDDRLSFTGLFPSATTMTGWMLTTANDFCVGDLFAIWR